MADNDKTPTVTTEKSPAVTNSAPGAATNAKKGGKQSQLPPGYKIIKVRMPDGTIAKIKRKVDDAPTPNDTKPVDASVTAAKKELAVISPAPGSSPAPVNGDKKPISEKSPTAAIVQPVKPPTASAKPATPVETTPSNTKSTNTTKASSLPAPPSQHRSRSSHFFATFAARTAAALIPDLGEFHDGDEVLPSDDDDDDGFDDDDNDNNVDNDNDNDNNNHDEQRDSSSMNQQQQQHHIGNDVAMAGTRGLAAGIGTPPPAYKGNVEKKLPRVDEKEIGLVDANATKPDEASASPRSLHKSVSDWTKYIIWAVMISFPVLFIVLGILTSILPTKSFDGEYATGVRNAIQVAISAWPIIFAAIAAQTLRSIANYRVERGIRVMSLEQLMGSNSVASSIKQPFLLRKFNLVTIALLLLWSLSPLATQALQRMSYDTQKMISSKAEVSYIDTWTVNHAFSGYDESHSVKLNELTIIKKFTLAATLPSGPRRQEYDDQYDFPRIPRIQTLDDSDGFAAEVYNEIENDYEYGFGEDSRNYSTQASDTEKFFDTYSSYDWSSSYGIPLQLPTNLEDSDELDFVISSSYLNFTCSNFIEVPRLAMNTSGVNPKPAENDTDWTTYMRILPLDATNSGHLFYYRFLRLEDPEVLSPFDDIFAYSKCNFSQTFIDSEINCVASGFSNSTDDSLDLSADCLVTGVRYTNVTRGITPMADFTVPFLSAIGDTIDSYLQNPTNTVYDVVGSDITGVSNEDFTTRLSLLVNTYWQLGFSAAVQVGNLDNITTPEDYDLRVAKARAIILRPTDTWVIETGWLVTLFLCSGILLLAGVVSIVLDRRTIVPDMLGFAASLARKSRYVDLPAGNTSMSGPERARMLADRRVMMQDVRPKAPVGKVALGYAREDAKRLEKGRLYK